MNADEPLCTVAPSFGPRSAVSGEAMNGGKRVVVRDLGLEWLRGASAIWSGLLRRSDADPVFMNDNHHRALGVRRRV